MILNFLNFLRAFVHVFKLKILIKRKRVSTNKIYLHFLAIQLRKKVISKLMFIRKAAVNIQIFMIWFDKNNSWEMGQLLTFFDKSLVQVKKLKKIFLYFFKNIGF